MLKMLSTQRRMERYRIIYAWKCIHGLAPNPGLEAVTNSERRGRVLKVPPITGKIRRIQSLKEQAFIINASRLFNTLPKVVRNIETKLEDFKFALDCFLEEIKDEPKTHELIPSALGENGRPP